MLRTDRKEGAEVSLTIRSSGEANAAVRIMRGSGNALSKSLERLASGYRINSAADDAAGLAISEKMRDLTRGLSQAQRNSCDGMSLIQTAEGALAEVHAMLNRASALAESSANGVYDDKTDRAALQEELDAIVSEIDRIAESTDFNGINLFQNAGPEYETVKSAYAAYKGLSSAGSTGSTGSVDIISSAATADSGSARRAYTMDEVIASTGEDEISIVYAERTDSVTATTSAAGSANSLAGEPVIEGKALSAILKEEIIPNTVKNILTWYPAFSYLTGSTIGIGLEYFHGNNTTMQNTLAYVTAGASMSGYTNGSITYTIGVNLDKLAGVTQRSDLEGAGNLEATIAHEMIHAFMDEAMTNGMFGYTGSGFVDSERFPSWFIEGMAQTASGPGDWITAMGITTSSADAYIQSVIGAAKNMLGSAVDSNYDEYGTGYLACMYLGAVIAGGGTPSSPVTAVAVSNGITSLMNEIISGKSLDTAINNLTQFSGTDDFVSNFNACSSEICTFIRDLLAATGSGCGGIVSGNLSDSDLVSNTSDTTVKLFELDPYNTSVRNVYPSGYATGSGGTASTDTTISPTGFTPGTPADTPAVTTRPFTVTGGTEGTDWEYDADGRTLVIMSGTALTISGGTGADENGDPVVGCIRIADGVGAVNLTLAGIECEMASGCAFDLGDGNNVSLTLKDGTENTFVSGSGYAGIALGRGTDLTVSGSDTAILNAVGGEHAAGIGRSYDESLSDSSSDIVINGGVINANGGMYGAGIGSGYNTDIGNITVNGGSITAKGGVGGAGIGASNNSSVGDITVTGGVINAESKGHGAGIGGGWGNTVNGVITISGGEITAVSYTHGTGIGAGCSGSSGDIIITGSAVVHKAQGGEAGAGIGASWYGRCGNIEISGDAVVENATGGNYGAGIGSGGDSDSSVGNITINTTGSVRAQAGENAVGIGSGYGYEGYYDEVSCGDITILQGTVFASGAVDSTGIGAGRGAVSGNITIGNEDNPDSKVVVTASGGMTNDGGNILSYTDSSHTQAGTITIIGNNTTVRAGEAGEGLYSTSGAVDEDGNSIYAYPVYLIAESQGAASLEAGSNALAFAAGLPLPAGTDRTTIKISSDTGDEWTLGLSHEDGGEDNYDFIWLKAQDQKLTVAYTDGSGTEQSVTLDLVYFDNAGVFRIRGTATPEDALIPEYSTMKPDTQTPDAPTPDTPEPDTPEIPAGDKRGMGGIILQIGARYGETLEVPRFYFSSEALHMKGVDISTQTNAWDSMDVIKSAINRVSDIRGEYGALANRLEHNQNNLDDMTLNITAAESRIRDLNMAEEMTAYTKNNILAQAAQSMLAQANSLPQGVLQLLQ